MDRIFAEQQSLHRRFRNATRLEIILGSAAFIAGALLGMFPAYMAWTLGSSILAFASRNIYRGYGRGPQIVPSATVIRLHQRVASVFREQGVPIPYLYVSEASQRMSSLRMFGRRGIIVVPSSFAALPDDQLKLLITRQSSFQRHHEPRRMQALNIARAGVSGYRRYLMWIPIWIAGGGQWGLHVFAMIAAGLGVVVSPVYIAAAMSGAVITVVANVVQRRATYRADRESIAASPFSNAPLKLKEAMRNSASFEHTAEVTNLHTLGNVVAKCSLGRRVIVPVLTVAEHLMGKQSQAVDQPTLVSRLSGLASATPSVSSRIKKIDKYVAQQRLEKRIHGANYTGEVVRFDGQLRPTKPVVKRVGFVELEA